MSDSWPVLNKWRVLLDYITQLTCIKSSFFIRPSFASLVHRGNDHQKTSSEYLNTDHVDCPQQTKMYIALIVSL